METLDFPIALNNQDRQICAIATLSAVLLMLPQIGFTLKHAYFLLGKERRGFDLTMFLLGLFGLIQLLIHTFSAIVTLGNFVAFDWLQIVASLMISTWVATLLLIILVMVEALFDSFLSNRASKDLEMIFFVLSFLVLVITVLLLIYFIVWQRAQYLIVTFSWMLIDGIAIKNTYKILALVTAGFAFFGSILLVLRRMTTTKTEERSKTGRPISLLPLIPASLLVGISLIFSTLILPTPQIGVAGTIGSHFLFLLSSAAFGIANMFRLCLPTPRSTSSAQVAEISSTTSPKGSISVSKQQKSFLKSLKHKLITKL